MRELIKASFTLVCWVPAALFFPLWWKVIRAGGEMASMAWILGLVISAVFILPLSSFVGSVGVGLVGEARGRHEPDTVLKILTAVALSPWVVFVGTVVWVVACK